MLIYVSIPITGYDEAERRERAEYIKSKLRDHYGDATVVAPFDIADKLSKIFKDPTYGEYMGNDLAVIIDEVNAVCFDELPWVTESRGVRLEYAAATLYGKACIFFKYLEK